MSEPATNAELDALLTAVVKLVEEHKLINAAQIHHSLTQQNHDITLPDLIQLLPTIRALKQEHNPFIGSMARWALADTSPES
jgi:hypothetical protein